MIWNENHPENRLNPHVIGPYAEGHWTNALFIYTQIQNNQYFKANISRVFKLHEWSQERNKQIEELVDLEETSIQLEMLIYLKFWEADMIIKNFISLQEH